MEAKAISSKPKITLLGDSTIDNKLWIFPGLIGNYLFDRLGIKRDDIATRIKKSDRKICKTQLSVVENLIKMLPTHNVLDYTNDGFTTKDLLFGAYKDKVFGEGNFTLFPHVFFAPIKEAEESIKQSDIIILSIGGNNVREFSQSALKIKNTQERYQFIRLNFDKILDEIKNDYIEIINRIRKLNSAAQIILMTQYYPSTKQNTYKIYPFMKQLGNALNIGGNPNDPMDVIFEIMKKSYFKIIENTAHENIVIADITSSLNPYDRKNYTSQIEPSAIGGKKIAQMLKFIILDKKYSARVYRFLPGFFNNPTNDEVEKIDFEKWRPNHPLVFMNQTT